MSTNKYVWIPEAPKYPGLYANKNGTDFETGKLSVKRPSTMSAHHALQFATREECQAWCDANPCPVFVPVQHAFSDAPDRAAAKDSLAQGECLYNPANAERDEAITKLRAREADLLALRSTLKWMAWHFVGAKDLTAQDRTAIGCDIDRALSSTSAAAQEIVERIEREAEERIFKAMFAAAARDGVVLDQAEEDQLRAAIFKEKG